MMRHNILLISVLLLHLSLWGQSADTLRQALALPVEARQATGDNLGQIYVVTTANALVKYAPDGRLLARYTNNRLGAIGTVDASNPLKILVWFADFRTAVLLDRSLTPLGELNLISAGFPEVRTVASSADGNLWLYDEIAFKLRKISPDGTPLFESQDLSQIMPERLNIACLRDDGTRLLAADPVQGLINFDAYGQFLKVLPLSGINDFQWLDESVIWHSGGVLHRYELRTFQDRLATLPVDTSGGAWIGASQIFVRSAKTLLVFHW